MGTEASKPGDDTLKPSDTRHKKTAAKLIDADTASRASLEESIARSVSRALSNPARSQRSASPASSRSSQPIRRTSALTLNREQDKDDVSISDLKKRIENKMKRLQDQVKPLGIQKDMVIGEVEALLSEFQPLGYLNPKGLPDDGLPPEQIELQYVSYQIGNTQKLLRALDKQIKDLDSALAVAQTNGDSSYFKSFGAAAFVDSIVQRRNDLTKRRTKEHQMLLNLNTEKAALEEGLG